MGTGARGMLTPQETARIKAGLDAFAFPAVLIDGEGTIVAVNTAWSEAALALGATNGATGPGISYLDVCRGATGVDSENANLIHAGIHEVLCGRAAHYTCEYGCTVGTRTRWYVVSCSRLPQRTPGATIAHLEITPWRRRGGKSEEVLRSQASFVANVGHDLRTPLNILFGYRDMLGDSELTDEQRELLDRIGAAALSLKVLVDDLVDYAKIDSGSLDIRERNFRLGEMLEAGLTPLLAQAQLRGLDAGLQIAPALAEVDLVGDPDRLRQVLINLVDNAIKFTREGFVRVKVLAGTSERGALRVRFIVEDSGSGIPATAQRDIFEPFYRRDARHVGGMGLGLSIAGRVIEQLGGEIGVDSEPERGSTFWFSVPLRLAGG